MEELECTTLERYCMMLQERLDALSDVVYRQQELLNARFGYLTAYDDIKHLIYLKDSGDKSRQLFFVKVYLKGSVSIDNIEKRMEESGLCEVVGSKIKLNECCCYQEELTSHPKVRQYVIGGINEVSDIEGDVCEFPSDVYVYQGLYDSCKSMKIKEFALKIYEYFADHLWLDVSFYSPMIFECERNLKPIEIYDVRNDVDIVYYWMCMMSLRYGYRLDKTIHVMWEEWLSQNCNSMDIDKFETILEQGYQYEYYNGCDALLPPKYSYVYKRDR